MKAGSIGGGAAPVGSGTTAFDVAVRSPYWGLRAELIEVRELVRRGQISVEIETSSIDEAPRAYELQEGGIRGRAVIVPNAALAIRYHLPMASSKPKSDSAPRTQPVERARPQCYDEVDEQSRESFPASDAPSFTPVTGTGAPSTTEGEANAKPQSVRSRRCSAGTPGTYGASMDGKPHLPPKLGEWMQG